MSNSKGDAIWVIQREFILLGKFTLKKTNNYSRSSLDSKSDRLLNTSNLLRNTILVIDPLLDQQPQTIHWHLLWIIWLRSKKAKLYSIHFLALEVLWYPQPILAPCAMELILTLEYYRAMLSDSFRRSQHLLHISKSSHSEWTLFLILKFTIWTNLRFWG